MTEKDIQNLCGKRNPYTVPEGYFDEFSQNIMNIVRQNQPAETITHTKSKFLKFRPWMAVAACFCAAVFALTIYLNKSVENDVAQMAQNEVVVSDDYDMQVAEYAEYAMLDNGDLYACLYEE